MQDVFKLDDAGGGEVAEEVVQRRVIDRLEVQVRLRINRPNGGSLRDALQDLLAPLYSTNKSGMRHQEGGGEGVTWGCDVEPVGEEARGGAGAEADVLVGRERVDEGEVFDLCGKDLLVFSAQKVAKDFLLHDGVVKRSLSKVCLRWLPHAAQTWLSLNSPPPRTDGPGGC
jgi:hypothetical protein